jgi:hypothetical protein
LRHLDERKPTGLARVTILNNGDALDGAVSREKGPQLIFSAGEIEVADKNVLQDCAPLLRDSSRKVIVMAFLPLLSLLGSLAPTAPSLKMLTTGSFRAERSEAD